MKLLTYKGPGRFQVVGHFVLESGQTTRVSDEMAEDLLRDNPDVALDVKPEAQSGEGSSDKKKEGS